MDVFLTEDPVQCSRLLHNIPMEAQNGISFTHFSPPRYLKASVQHYTQNSVPLSKKIDNHLEGAGWAPRHIWLNMDSTLSFLQRCSNPENSDPLGRYYTDCTMHIVPCCRSPNPCLPQQHDTIPYAVKISVLRSWRWEKKWTKTDWADLVDQ